MQAGVIFDIRELTVHDGPGVRTTVFLKGCPLRCNWCHNPEGLDPRPELMIRRAGCTNCGLCRQGCGHEECRPFDRCAKICPQNLIQICGKEIDAKTLAATLKKNADIFEETGGGVTVSGGEPLLQPEFLTALLEELAPLHTAVETSGYGDADAFMRVVEIADLILFDIKHMDSDAHKRWTGVDNRLILQNLERLMSSGKRFTARMPLIPGVNDTEENFAAMASFLSGAKDRLTLEVLPYNRLAGAKHDSVSREYRPEFDVDAAVRFSGEEFDRRGIGWKVL